MSMPAQDFIQSIVNRLDDKVSNTPDMSLVSSDLTIPPRFDEKSLPEDWAEWCLEHADSQAVPVDYVVCNLLTTCSAWLGNARRVSPSPDWKEPPHLWGALVGGPSAGKTPSLKIFAEVTKSLEHEETFEHLNILNSYESQAEAVKAKQDYWKSQVADAVKKGINPPERPFDAITPDKPPTPRIMVNDSTSQQLQNILAGNPKGILQFRDELSGWVGSLDRYNGNGADRAFYLEAYNGGSYTIDLVKNNNQPLHIQYTSVAILGGFQPDKLREALSGADDGLASRLSYIYPEPTPYRALRKESHEASEARRIKLEKVARRLRSLSMLKRDDDTPVPKMVGLSALALVMFEKIREESITRSRESRGLAAGWHGKTPSRALRLALTIEYLSWASSDSSTPEPSSISEETMACVGTYIDYLGRMFERAMDNISGNQSDDDASEIARYIQKHKLSKINERDLYQTKGFSHLREPKRRKEAFETLERANWVTPANDSLLGRPKGDWIVNFNFEGGVQ